MRKLFYKIISLSVLTFLVQAFSYSQEIKMSSISGNIIDADTKEPVFACAVVIVELNLWTTTDDKGYYKIEKIPAGREYTITASSLGMERFEKKILLLENKNQELNIFIKQVSFKMEEVVVLAEEKSGLGSSSNIQKTAINHLQPSSLKDVMQLLPGQISSNPDLSGKAVISIRDISSDVEKEKTGHDGSDNNSSFGTAIIVDGSPLSNNADLQISSTSYSAVDASGVDVRQISTDNIESVEVIRGIASVEYGDMTSGAVIVKTKSGSTPLNAKVSLNPNIKKAYLGKGFNIKNLGAVNFDIDYTNSIDNKITPYEGFNRISTQLGYSKTFMRSSTPLTFNIKGRFSQTLDFLKTDPDIISANEKINSSETGYKVNVYGKWGLKKKLISNINYNISANVRNQERFEKKIVTLGYIQPISNARKDTLMEGEYAPSEYYSEMKIKGKPYDFFAKIAASTVSRKGEILNKILYGFDYRSSGNNGEGRIYDELRPPRLGGGSATRPRSYKDIPALNQYSFFLEDNLTLPVNKSLLFIQVGLRYNNYQPESIFKSKLKTIIEPRLNLKYQLLNSENSALFENLSLFGGYGIQSKSPTISHLYPDVAYFDLNSFNYFSENPDERLLLVTTRVLETDNDELEPIKVEKYELGLEGKLKSVNFLFTGYYENSDNGLDFSNQNAFLEFYRWDITDPNIIYPTGSPPIVNLTNPTEIDTFIASYSTPSNNQVMIKKGLEYRFDFKKIKSIQTSISVNGGYLYTKNYTGSETQMLPTGSGAEQLPFVAVYPAGSGKERTRFNTNIIAVSHIPKLRLVFTTTLQIIWKNSYKYFLGGGQPWNYESPAKDYIVKAPVALIDKEGTRYDIPKEDILNIEYDDYLVKYTSDYFNAESQPIHYQLNLKVSSEIGSKARFAFFANNFTMHNPKYKSKRTNSTITLNSPLYFGLELTFKF